MEFFRHLFLLLWKNFLLKIRAPCSLCCELGLPLGLIGVFAGLYFVFEVQKFETQQYIDNEQSVEPFFVLPRRMQLYDWRIGIVASGGQPTIDMRDTFVTWLEGIHPAFNGSEAGFQTEAFQNLYVPPVSEAIRTFDSEGEFDDYIKNNEYGARGDRPRIWAAVDFESVDEDTGGVRYKLRFNVSDMQDTFEVIDPVQRGQDLDVQNNFILSTQAESDTDDVPDAHLETPEDERAITRPMPSASTLQREVDRFLIQRKIDPTLLGNINGETVTEIISSSFFQLGFDIDQINLELAALEQANLTETVLAGIALNSFESEQYQPQSISMIPFPITSYDENGFYETVRDLLPFFFVLTLVYPISQLIRGLVMEKETRIREGMQMMGLGEGPLIVSWILTYVIIFLLLALLIAAITSNNMFRESGFGPVFFLFWLLGISSTAFGYFVSVFFNGARTASFVGVLLFIGIYFPYTSVSGPQHELSAKRAASLCAPTAFSLSLNQGVLFEEQGLGVTFDNADLVLQNWQFGIGLWMMVIDTMLYIFLGWYFDNVLPSWFRQYGVPRPFYFLCTAEYWSEIVGAEAQIQADKEHSDDNSPSMRAAATRSGRSSVASTGRATPADPSDSPAKYPNVADYHLVEPLGTEQRESLAHNRGIKIRGLRKQFGDKVAVHGLNFELLENNVNCLLGHNGAGKTTTIGMLTGLIGPTEGTARIYGYDIRTQMPEIRKMMGVCPQHDVLWPELTVKEHLYLYAGFKGVESDKVEEEVNKAIADVGLTEKVDAQTMSLSGGQKRKLSVAIAFLGDSKLVLLDEPTSGVDPFSRRNMWDIIKRRRAGCTILLTTHFMDEADKLGDRVTIAAHGKIQCSGTPMFLKSKYGVGYQLSIVKKTSRDGDQNCNVRKVTEVIRRHIEGADIASNVGTELIYRLPLSEAGNFAAMFAELDEDIKKDPSKAELHIMSYGVSVTTMEEVFLRVAHGEDRSEVLGVAKGASTRRVGQVQKVEDSGAAGASTHAGEVEMTQDGKSGAPAGAPRKDAGGDAEEGGMAAQALTIDAVRERARQDADNLCMRHFMALLTKRACYIRRDFLAFCFQLLIPIIVVIFALLLLRSGTPTEFPEVLLEPSGVQSQDLSTAVPILSYYSTDTSATTADPVITARIAQITDSDLDITAIGPNDASLPTTGPLIDQLIEDAADSGGSFFGRRMQAEANVSTLTQPDYDYARLSQYLLNNKDERQSAQMGAFAFKSKLFDDIQDGGATAASYTVLHNTTYFFGPGLWASIMNSALYREARASRSETVDASTQIKIAIHPLPFTASQELFVGSFISLFAALAILVAFSFIPASYAVFIVREREVSAKHQQLISGVSIWAYWLSTYVFDITSYLIPCFLTIAVIAAYDIQTFIDTADQRLAGLILIFLTYGLAVAAFTYCLTYLFKSYTAALVSVLALNIFAVILMIASFVMDKIKATCREDRVLRYFYRLVPGFALGNGLLNLSFLDQLAFLDRICDAQHNPDQEFGEISNYKALDWNALGANIWMMLIEAVVYFLLAVGIDYIQANPALLRLCTVEDMTEPPAAKHVDQDVRAEEQRVAPLEGKGQDDILVVKGIRKCYPGGKHAVRGVSFGVPVGNVFALLGINGAGKSSTFKMLSGDTVPTAGSAMVAGYDVVDQQMDVRRLLGYCPQFDALLDLLTVREHLELYGRIKSVPEEQLEELVQQKMKQMDIEEYENVQSYALSGGNKRKLSVAIALIGDPPLILLDECTTGVDPVARRKLWTVIQDVTDKQRICSIVICTHSMEEAESLSNNLTVMVSGRLKCLGSTQHIKNRFGKAYMAEIRMAKVEDETVEQLAQSLLGVAPDVLPSHTVSRAEINRICQQNNRMDRAQSIAPGQAGWSVNAALQAAEFAAPPAMRAAAGIPAKTFLAWWADMDQSEAMVAHICNEAFPAHNAVPGSEGMTRVVERHSNMFRFKIPFQRNMTLGQMFSTLEGCKERLHMEEYSLSQTSLEQIFNQFAAEQEEERTLAPGMIAAAPAQGGGAASAAGGSATPVSPAPGQPAPTQAHGEKLV